MTLLAMLVAVGSFKFPSEAPDATSICVTSSMVCGCSFSLHLRHRYVLEVHLSPVKVLFLI